MLSFMCIPLALGFLAYHIYLIWAGMTTNESAKWSDWKEDIGDKVVFRAEMKKIRESFSPLPEDVEPREEDVRWPTGVRAKWWLVRTRDGEQPKKRKFGGAKGQGQNGKAAAVGEGNGRSEEEEIPDERWTRVQSLAQVENLYDLGFWDNLRDGLFNRGQ
jgi:palmitoyltransferase